MKPFITRTITLSAFFVPLSLGIFFASSEPYWLDSPEFTAAAVTLGIPHPPGHPLYVMLVAPFTLLPIGNIAFRVALASALFGAIGSFLLFTICARIIETISPLTTTWKKLIMALAVALLASVSRGWWFQCVRAEVYSLQIALVLATLYPLVVYCLQMRPRDMRLLSLSAFGFGLSLSNHHFIALATLPAAIPVFVALAAHKGIRHTAAQVTRLGALTLLGTLPYLFLPIRSLTPIPMALGGVHSISDFVWVVSAKVYQKAMSAEHEMAFNDRSLDVLFSMMGELGPVLLIFSVAGIYVLLRWRTTRLLGALILTITGTMTLLRGFMGFDPFNPDYYGYMLVVICGLTMGLAVFIAVGCSAVERSFKYGKGVVVAILVSLLVFAVFKGRTVRQDIDLSDFRATRLFYDFATAGAHPNTIVFCHYYKTFFVYWSQRFIDGSRSDMDVINPYFLGYPGYAETLVRNFPELKKLVWSMLVEKGLTAAAIADMALSRPLRIEPSSEFDNEINRHFLPAGPLFEAHPEPLALTDVESASTLHFEKWRLFYSLLEEGWQEHETKRLLTWQHYQDALFFATLGDLDSARKAVSMGLHLSPKASQLKGLEALLSTKERGPVDVTPFFPGGRP